MSKQDKLRQIFQQIRSKTMDLVASLQTEDFVAQPITDVSPPKWHLGHTTWFFENFILKAYSPDYQIYKPDFFFLFNSYYISQGDRLQRDKRGSLTRPSTEEVMEYRKVIDQRLVALLDQIQLKEEALFFLELGIHHEQQHQELLITDIKYIFSCNPLLPAYRNESPKGSDSNLMPLEFLPVQGGIHQIGHSGEGFCFDNELSLHRVYLDDFQVSNRLISKGEYLEFMNDGAYEKANLWLSEGWDWIQGHGVRSPEYWFQGEGQWLNFTLNGVKEIQMNDTLSHVSFFEAEAFARWSGKRLLTEFEWEVASKIHGNRATAHFQEQNRFHLPEAKDSQFFGTAWEWCNSAYLPYPKYQQAKGALGEYNGKFMVNQMVLRGGSCATPRDHFRPSYRNFFHPHLRWQYTGIRLADK